MNIYKFFISTIKKCKLFFITSSILALLPDALSSFAHIYYAKILNFIAKDLSNSFNSTLLSYIIIFALIQITIDLINYIRIQIDARVKIRYQMSLHNTLFAHNHAHSPNFFDTNQSGVILGKTGTLINSMCQLFGNIRAYILPNLSTFVVTFFIFYNISPLFCAILFILSVINLSITYKVLQKVKSYVKIRSNENSKIMGILVDSIANARLVKSTSSLYHEKKKLRHQANIYIRARQKEAHIRGISRIQNTLLITLFMVLNLAIIIAFYYYQNLSLEHIILATTLSMRLNDHIEQTAYLIGELISIKASIDDTLELLYQPFEIKDIPNAKKLKLKDNSICFKDVSFQYSKDKPLFNNLNLSIKPNEKIGLVGLSGSGKSTLIKLILRSYNLNKGKILISNQDISKTTLFSLHQNISLISQEPCLFNRSIMDNLKFANKNATFDDIINACKLAHIHDIIEKMPLGYDSIIGERGVKLSGGERQRISIAQSILKNTPILILDEATSALDSDSELAIEKALSNIMKNKTVIAIAHRLSTLKNMDRIIVLDNGKIIEEGTIKELLKNKDGTFYHLYKLQTEGYL
ncbi:MAG: ABC transporter ATP-binding protein [Alphaproteobacteria bacterium]|nr:ABC transporter ATP-binding protein [Alphaproteobacteria bacterium]